MKNKKLIISLAIFLIVTVATFAITYFTVGPGAEKQGEKAPSSSIDDKKGDTQKAEKTITVKVIFKDKSEKEFKIDTDAEYLGDALLEEKIVTEDEYKNGGGMYIYIDGERADYTKDKSWWCLMIDGEMATVGINDTPISDGDSFEIKNTPA